MKKNEEICTVLYQCGMIWLIKEQFDKFFLASHREIYGEYKACFYSGGIYNIFLLWLEHRCRETPEELADELSQIMEK